MDEYADTHKKRLREDVKKDLDPGDDYNDRLEDAIKAFAIIEMNDALDPSPPVMEVVSFLNAAIDLPKNDTFVSKPLGGNLYEISFNPKKKYTEGADHENNEVGKDESILKSDGADDLIKKNFLSEIGQNLPENWSVFSGKNHIEFAQELKRFRRTDDLTFDKKLRGGEGQLFESTVTDEKVLKRWFESRVDDMPESVKLLEDARVIIEENASLKELVDVVTVDERGADWIIRGFDRKSIPLKSAVSDQMVDKIRQSAIELLSKEESELAKNILKKLTKNSANLHWSPKTQKILIIDMQ